VGPYKQPLDHNFSIIGISETRIINTVPTPLSAGGVGMYIDDNLNYRIIEKSSNEAFQALWVEIEFTD
jgi:hypothetical protein